jgi:hypothetical protein
MGNGDLTADGVIPRCHYAYFGPGDLQKVLDFGQPPLQKLQFWDDYKRRLSTLRQNIEGYDRLAALVPAHEGGKILIQNGFGCILLIALQFTMELYGQGVEGPPPVYQAVGLLISLAKIEELVQEPAGDQIVSTLLSQAVDLRGDIADPFAPVVAHLIVWIGKNKALVKLALQHGREPLRGNFDPLGNQYIQRL